MQIYGKIEDGFVTEIVMAKNWTPPSGEEAMWEIIPDNVELGWEKVGDDFNDDAIQWQLVEDKQKLLINGVRARVERYMTQRDLGMPEAERSDSPEKYQELLQYLQDIRVNDETTHANPEDAHAALDALVKPE